MRNGVRTQEKTTESKLVKDRWVEDGEREIRKANQNERCKGQEF